MRIMTRLSITTLSAILVACTSYEPGPEIGTQAYRDSLRVLTQVCMPRSFGGEYLSMSQVNRYGSHGEMRSVLSGAEKKVGTSSSGRPVFEHFSHRRQIDLVAIMVNVGETQYVYD